MAGNKGRKRPHTLLKESSTTRHPNPRRESQLQSDSGTLTINPVVVVEADQSLQQFPQEVRNQIDAYFNKPDANPKTLVSAMKQLSLHKTAKGEPCCFVEMGTTNVLDAATYQCGPVLHRGLITVIKPRPGSTFNNGNAAVIHYYGKGSNSDGRNISSRWSIWTPDGIRADLLVERMITGEAPDEDSDDVISPTPKRKKPKLGRKKRTTTQKKNTQKTISSADSQAGTEVENDDATETETTTKVERGASDLFVSEADDDSYQRDLVAGLPPAQQYPLPVHQGPWGMSTATPAARQPSTYAETPSMSAPHGSLPRHTPHPQVPSPNNNQTIIYFRRFDGESHLSKTLTQCDSVEKLFAYAFKAGISGPDLMLLTASVGNFTVDIIRGDHDDFAELLRAIQDQQMVVGEDVAVRVFVTSVMY